MDWDDVRATASGAAKLGEDLSTLSIEELNDRVAALQAEIARVQVEIARKKAQADAAASIFKS